MAIKYRESTEHNIYPNITVDERYDDTNPTVITGFRVTANDGYVYYDRNAQDTELQVDPETGDYVYDPETGLPVEVPVTYYYRIKYLVRNYNFDNFPYVAVLRSTVDENYIFGGGNNDHEVMSNEEETVTE